MLGGELVALAVVAGGGLFTLDRRAEREQDVPRLARTLDVVSPNLVTLLLTAAAGVVVVTGQVWGLYLLMASTVIGIVGGIANAWLFLTTLDE